MVSAKGCESSAKGHYEKENLRSTVASETVNTKAPSLPLLQSLMMSTFASRIRGGNGPSIQRLR